MKRNAEWWHEFFAEFRPVFDIVPPKMTNAVTRYIIRKLGLRKGNSFLDCPCGIGRIAIPLAKKGIRVTGVDFMQSYLDELDKRAEKLSLPIKTFRVDMRRIQFDNEFNAAGSLWTSIGYFDKESDNLLVIKKMFRALKPGGKLVLQAANRDYLVSHFMPTHWFQVGKVRVFEKAEFDYETSTISNTWHFDRGGRETTRDMRVRIYSFHELVAMFKKAGFVDVHGSGSIKDEAVSYERQTLFVFGIKPKG